MRWVNKEVDKDWEIGTVIRMIFRAIPEKNNPATLRDMAECRIEALDRGLWRPKSNNAYCAFQKLASREK